MFQKKKSGTGTGTKKKKKKGTSSTSGSAQSPSPGAKERRRRSTSQDRGAKVKPEAAVTEEEKVAKGESEDGEMEEISQADTDRDAPSIASEVGSPIPFDVSLILDHLIWITVRCFRAYAPLQVHDSYARIPEEQLQVETVHIVSACRLNIWLR